METAVSLVHPSEVTTRDTATQGHRILVCVDRSDPADDCLAHAIVLARALGSEVTLVHVLQPFDQICSPHDVLDWEVARQEAHAHLEHLADQVTRALGRAPDVRLEQGHAAERIVELMREINADLTVMGSHGDGATTWNLGRTVQQVVRTSRGSVFIVPPACPVNPRSPQRIVVPLDGSPRTESVLPTAARLAEPYDAELILLHVAQALLPTSVLHTGEDLELASRLAARLKISAKAYLEELRSRLVREGVRVRTVVEHHVNERHCIVETARRESADLIVVAAHGAACDPSRTFGTVTEYLMAHSVVPVLVLQDLPHSELHAPEFADKMAPPLRASFPPEYV